jgi:hypothetical protein
MVGFSTQGQNISSQFGMPLFGIAGSLPPFTGNYFWVDGTNGSDGNTGGAQDPFKTLTQALSACLSGNNDVVFFTGTFSPTATFVWNKNNTHLIGLDINGPYPTPTISVASTAATAGAFSPLVSVTATGCIFQNLSVVSGIAQAATQVAWAEAGGLNSYFNVNINQVGNATAAAQAGNRALTIASVNNYFESCVIGGDSVIRATGTNISMELLGGAGSSIFKGCTFPIYTSVAANTFVATTATTLSGYFIFDSCYFINDANNTSAVTLTDAFIAATASKAVIVLTANSTIVGATASAAAGAVFVTAAASAATGAIAVVT